MRRASADLVLALLAASALSPVALGVLGGGSVADAIAGVAGNVGSGYLTALVTSIAARLRRNGSVDLSEARELLTAEFQAALAKGDAPADELRGSLAYLIGEVGGLDAAVGELRGHLLACFQELTAQALKHAAAQERQHQRTHAAQRRHTRQLQEQGRQLQEIVERLRLLTRNAQRDADPPVVVTPTVMPASTWPGEPPGASWQGGVEMSVGGHVYLLHEVLLAERTHADGTVLRQARALRLGDGRDRYVWLRQVRTRPDVPGAGRMLLALDRERKLLARLGGPRVSQYQADGRTATLALVWPESRAHGPAEVLSPSDPPGLFPLLGGLAGLCDVLAWLHALGATHRLVTPERIVARDDGRLSFLDLGLAGHDHAPGEGPADYQAPEQRRRGTVRPGPCTDTYQLAAVAYHLLAGHPPHPRTPLPVRGQVRDLPGPAGAAIDAALSADPGARPTASSFGAALRAARDQL